MSQTTEPGSPPQTYAEASAELEEILGGLEAETVDVDQLVSRVRRARELIGYCREQIRRAEVEVEEIVGDLGGDEPAGNDEPPWDPQAEF